MKGCAIAAKREYEAIVIQAWHGANMANAGGKLKNLDHYLPKDEEAPPPPAVKPEIILDAMLTMRAYGVPIEITKVETGTPLEIET